MAAECGDNKKDTEPVSPKSDFGGFQSVADSAIGWWSDLDQPVALSGGDPTGGDGALWLGVAGGVDISATVCRESVRLST